MPWKEPGEKPREPKERKPREREPWGADRPGRGPDLETWLRKFRRGLGPFGRGPWGWLALLAAVVVLWFLIGGWTMIGDHEVGVVQRFGRLEAVLQPGLHLRFPSPIDRVRKIDTGQVRTLSDETRLMTRDGQLVRVDYYAQYKVTDARAFLFSTRDTEDAARNAAAVAVRAAVGTHALQQLLKDDGGDLGHAISQRLQERVSHDDLGIHVVEAGIQHVGVPSQVKPTFDDIAKAREQAKSAKATAEADAARDQVKAKAEAASIRAAAAEYRATAAAQAEADVARFDQVLGQYQAAPQVTRHQLWLDAMRDVLSNNHVVVNTGSGNVIVQFPARPAQAATPAPAASAAPAPASAQSSAPPLTSGPALQGAGA